MLLELRHALRRLRTSPGFALTAIATLALAIGTTTAMVAVLDAVLLRRLPFPSADRLAVVWQELPAQGVREARSAFGTVDGWRRESRSLEEVAVLDPATALLEHAGEVERIGSSRVSPDLFALLGVVPARGRAVHRRRRERPPACRGDLAPLLAGALRIVAGGRRRDRADRRPGVADRRRAARVAGRRRLRGRRLGAAHGVRGLGGSSDRDRPRTLVRIRPRARGHDARHGATRARRHRQAAGRRTTGCRRRPHRPRRPAARAAGRCPIERGRVDAGRRDGAAVAGGRGQRRRADHRPWPRAPAAAGDPGGARRQPRSPRAIPAGRERPGGRVRRHRRSRHGRRRDGGDPCARTTLRGASCRRPPRRAGARLGGGRVGADRPRDRADASPRRLAAGSARRRRPGHRVGRGLAGPPTLRRGRMRDGRGAAGRRRPVPAQLVEREPRRSGFPGGPRAGAARRDAARPARGAARRLLRRRARARGRRARCRASRDQQRAVRRHGAGAADRRGRRRARRHPVAAAAPRRDRR